MRILRSDRGSVLALTAFSMAMLLAFMALAVDASNLYYNQRQLQTIADTAAMAGALEASYCGTAGCAIVTTAATSAMTEGGYTTTLFTQCAAASGSGILLTINNGPCALGSSDPNNGNANYVEAVVSEKVPTYFAKVFGVNTVTLSARAEAGHATAPNGGPCLNTNSLTLNSGASITDANGSTCGINDNATGGLSTNSGVTINVGSFTYHGTSYNKNCGSCTTYSPMPTTGTAIVSDPYSSLTPPSQPNTTDTNVSTISGTTTLDPGYYSNTINFNSGTYTVTLNPGLYYFGSGFNIDSNVTITGSNVTLFFGSGANVNVNSAATWILTAPTSAITTTGDACASCAGMLIWDTGGGLNLDASSSSSFGGAVYLPNGQLTLNGGSTSAAYGQIFANSVMVDSAISLSGGSSGTYNGSKNPALAE